MAAVDNICDKMCACIDIIHQKTWYGIWPSMPAMVIFENHQCRCQHTCFSNKKNRSPRLCDIILDPTRAISFLKKTTKRFQTRGSSGLNVGVVDACIFAFAPLASYENRFLIISRIWCLVIDAHNLHSRSQSSPKIPFYLFPFRFKMGFSLGKKSSSKIRTWGFSPICHYRILGHFITLSH